MSIKTGLITLHEIKRNRDILAYIDAADQSMGALGYTEHGQRHANLVAHIAENILLRLGYPERRAQLAAIAGFLHDVGNMVNREHHGLTGALLVLEILKPLGMEMPEMAAIAMAIGNHEEEEGDPVSDIAAAIILADKSDVHRSRVRNQDMTTFDIHDRVNYAAHRSFLRVDGEKKTIGLEIEIDTEISALMDYFEIFLSRMLISRRSAKVLGCDFELTINKVKLL